MSNAPLLKGFEVELFTGRSSGENVGVSSEVIRELPGFVTEPDRRNLEYITAPLAAYDELKMHFSRHDVSCVHGCQPAT